MIIYNVTVKVDHSIADDYLTWLREEYIPDMLGTGCFTDASVLHLLEADDEEGITYAIQYHAKNLALYQEYLEKFDKEKRKKAIDKWGNKFVTFPTVMRVVN